MVVHQVKQMRRFMYSESTLSCSQEPTVTRPCTRHYLQSSDQGFYVVTKRSPRHITHTVHSQSEIMKTGM